MPMITSEDFAVAVENAGGDVAAAALMGVSVASVRRYQNALPNKRTTQALIRRTMSEYLPGGRRPLASFEDEELIRELRRRVTEVESLLVGNKLDEQATEEPESAELPATERLGSREIKGRSRLERISDDADGDDTRDDSGNRKA